MSKSAICRTGIITAVLGLLLPALAAAAAQSQEESSLSLVPSNATAFVHFNLFEMTQTPGMVVPVEVVAGVKNEVDELFERHLGIRISELKEATYVMPTMESLMALQSNDPLAGFWQITFSQPVNEGLVVKRMPGTWSSSKIGTTTVFVESSTDNSMFRCSTNTIAFGATDSITWFVENRGKLTNDGLRSVLNVAQSNHVTFAVNGDEIPSEMKMFAPSEMGSIIKAKSTAIGLNFNQGIAVRARMNFNSKSDATDAASFVRQGVTEARARLKQEEANTLRQFRTDTERLDRAFTPLAMLAMNRYGDKVLNEIQIDQTDDRLDASVAIENLDGHMIVITGLSMIQFIGMSAEAEFENVASQLNQ